MPSNIQKITDYGLNVPESLGFRMLPETIEPRGLAFQNLGGVRRCWVACTEANSVGLLVGSTFAETNCALSGSVIDPLVAVRRIRVGTSPRGIAVNPTNNKLYVSNFYDDTVTIIDVSNANASACSILATVSLPSGGRPSVIAVDSVSGMVGVVNQVGNSVTLIDGTTDAVIASVSVSPNPYGLAFDTQTAKLYVASSAGSPPHISIISESSHTIVDTITLPRWPGGPIAIDVVNRTLAQVVSNIDTFPATSEVVFYNVDTKALLATVSLGEYSFSVPWSQSAINQSGHRLYLDATNTTSFNHYAFDINMTTLALVQTWELTGWCFGALALDPTNSVLYVTGWDYKRDSVVTVSTSTYADITSKKLHYAKSAWYEVTAATSIDASALLISLESGTQGYPQTALTDIAIGAAGQEKVIASNLICTANGEYLPSMWLLKLPIPAGSRISARVQATIYLNGSPWIAIYALAGGFDADAPLGRIVAYGADFLTTRGRAVDPGGTVNTYGAWVDFGVPTQNIKELFVAFACPCQSDDEHVSDPVSPKIWSPTLGNWFFEVGIGDGTVSGTQILLYDLAASIDGGVSGPMPGLYGPLPIDIPSGSNLWVRAKADINTVGPSPERKVDVVLYGVD